MPMQDLSREHQRRIRFAYRAKQLELTKAWHRAKRSAGMSHKDRLTQAAQDRMLMRDVAKKAKNSEWWCKRAVGQMFAGLPASARVVSLSLDTRNSDYRRRLRKAAIKAMGGCCQAKGCDYHDWRALQFYHTVPVRRGMSGKSKSYETSDEICRMVLAGRTKGLKLLCCNCSRIATLKDQALHCNERRARR